MNSCCLKPLNIPAVNEAALRISSFVEPRYSNDLSNTSFCGEKSLKKLRTKT